MPFGDFLVLDKTREEHPAQSLRPGLFLLSYSPELNLIERPWKLTKRCTFYGRYHPTFPDFQAVIPEVLDALPTKDSRQPVSWMTRIFRVSETPH